MQLKLLYARFMLASFLHTNFRNQTIGATSLLTRTNNSSQNWGPRRNAWVPLFPFPINLRMGPDRNPGRAPIAFDIIWVSPKIKEPGLRRF